MKKSSTFIDLKTDTDTKSLFKTINEISHYLDHQKNQSKFVNDLFLNHVESQRSRLCNYIEKLMFLAPVEYGRKCEEILWRKCFYDVYAISKRLKKEDTWSYNELYLINKMLYSGIGFYHYLIAKIQEEFFLVLDGIPEFPLSKFDFGLCNSKLVNQTNSMENKSGQTQKVKEWAKSCVHRNLVCIGDLNRYMLDFYPGWDISCAFHYYMKALYLNPDAGIPHNQLGTLSNAQNHILDAVYRYIRCLYCKEFFDGAEGNLVAIMEQYPAMGLTHSNLPLRKRIFSQFLNLIGVWFLQKSPIKDVDLLCSEFVENINLWFPKVTNTSLLKHEPITLNNLVETKCTKPFDLIESESTILKILIIFIMCHHKLLEKRNKTDSVSTVIIAVISRTLEYIIDKLKEVIPAPVPPTVVEKDKINKNTKSNNRRRRHRRLFIKTKSASDDELSQHSYASQNGKDNNEDDGEETLIFDEYFDEENANVLNPSREDKVNEINGEKETIDSNNATDIKNLEKVLQEHYCMMQVVKVACDWLRCNENIFSPISSWKVVLQNFSQLLNYTVSLIWSKNKDKDSVKENIPLPEDVELKELPALKNVQDKLCWNWKKINSQTTEEEMKLRVQCLFDFGKFLASLPNTILFFDKERNWFSTSITDGIITKNEKTNLNDKLSGKLMKEMGQLWLEAEVKNLESKVKQISKVNLLTPYLVVDTEALTLHCILVKKLVNSKQFVLLVPAAVISTLDELKRTSIGARDAIRWLETQFRQGNQFLRAQRNNEKLSIPSILYPAKKDNKSWLFIQIVEFCYYLNETNIKNIKDSAADKKDEDVTFVRLLTGSRALSNQNGKNIIKEDKSKQMPFTVSVIKKSTGVSVEHIVDFYGKWKDSIKSHG